MTAQFQNQCKILHARTDQNTNSVNILTNNITEFHYNLTGRKVFTSWFKCYLSQWFFSQRWKIHLVICKLGTKEQDSDINYILLKQATKFTLNETLEQFSDVFEEKQSLLNNWFNCLKLTKEDVYFMFAGYINQNSKKFKLNFHTEEQFKWDFYCRIKIFSCWGSHPTFIKTGTGQRHYFKSPHHWVQ